MTDMHIERLFPTPIAQIMLAPEVQAEILAEYELARPLIESELHRPWKNDPVRATFKSTRANNLVVEHKLDCLAKQVLMRVPEFASHTPLYQTGNAYIESSWVNYQDQYQFHHRHRHVPVSDISAVYYLQAQGTEGNIIFYPCDSMNVGYEQEFTPSTGLLLMFPSWAAHSVAMNTTTNRRISIAMNIVL